MAHKKTGSSIPLFDGDFSRPSVVEGSSRPVSPERTVTLSRQRSRSTTSHSAERACRCDDPPPPPPRRNSRGALSIASPARMAAAVSAAAAAAVPGPATVRQRESLLTPSPGALGASVVMKVDGHHATATLGSSGLSWSYEFSKCCVPGVRSENVPFSEILSAEMMPDTRGMWSLPGTRLHRMVIYTFRRSPRNPAYWFPRQLVLESASEGVMQEWLKQINTAVAAQSRRPRRLLVFVNPFGGSRRARAIWENVVRPVFDKAGIKSRAVETQHGGHAHTLLTSMPGEELAAYDGVVAIGGDGLFHEVINGLLELRSIPTGTTLDQAQWAELQHHLEQIASADAAAAAAMAAAAASIRGESPAMPAGGQLGTAAAAAAGAAAIPGQQQGAAAPAPVEQQLQLAEGNGVGGPLIKGGSFGLPGLPGSARHRRRHPPHRRVGSVAASLRVGHIPAGSTDAVACTLNGTRSAFTAAVHIALGDACPLDVLRIDSAEGEHAFATCMVSYGFMGDVMAESENYRWLGPMRYDVIGAKMLAANRSYRVRVSYLPAQPEQIAAAGKVCIAGCQLCRLGREQAKAQRAFREASSRSLTRRCSEWVHLEGDYAGIMLVIMPCRSEKSQSGVARYGHLSDGLIHLVMVKKCSRLQYLRFLLTLSHTGLSAGEHGFFTVVPAVAVHVEPVSAKQSRWNADGELLAHNHITAEVHRGVIEVFARGVEV